MIIKKSDISKPLWKGKQKSYEEALVYLNNRRIGKESSLITPWAKVNDATVNGLEWNSTTIIAGRPGTGKTLIKDQIIKESFVLNPEENFNVLEFNFEMVGKSSAIREFSSVTGLTYKQLASANETLNEYDLKRCYEYAKTRTKYPIHSIDEPLDIEGMATQLDLYCNANPNKKVVVTLDHTLLVNNGFGHKSKTDMLSDLANFFTQSKKHYPILWIVLSQLNRKAETPERAINGKYGNYITEDDIFGSDAMLQHADTLLGINRPAKRQIKYYGPEKYVIQSPDDLVFHFLKCRTGNTRMSFFKGLFSQMKVVEMMTPPKKN